MSRHTELATRAEAHLATAETGADDPQVAALCALAAALLATRPACLRRAPIRLDLDQYLADIEHDTSPATVAVRAVVTSMQAAAAELDGLNVDDGGFPTDLTIS
jgi:glycerol-3-phosphate O-acyltransferase